MEEIVSASPAWRIFVFHAPHRSSFAAPLAVFASLTVCLAVAAGEPTSGTKGIELIRDPRFERGLRVKVPQHPGKTLEGTLRWDDARPEPIWDLAQWHSRTGIVGVAPERTASGALRFANAAKEVWLAPGLAEDGDLVLRVNGHEEYGPRARQRGEKWPHLLISLRLPDCPPLVELASLTVSLRARLRGADEYRPEGHNPRMHAAQFLMFLTVQDLKPESPGRGDFLWFGIPIFDTRWPQPRKHVAGDAASGKLIFTPSGDAYTSSSLHDRQWASLERDVLPLTFEAIQTAWDKGFLAKSRELSGFRIGGMNLGWEVTGSWNVEAQVRDLSVRARRKPESAGRR
jgi:hypothetical protein